MNKITVALITIVAIIISLICLFLGGLSALLNVTTLAAFFITLGVGIFVTCGIFLFSKA